MRGAEPLAHGMQKTPCQLGMRAEQSSSVGIIQHGKRAVGLGNGGCGVAAAVKQHHFGKKLLRRDHLKELFAALSICFYELDRAS